MSWITTRPSSAERLYHLNSRIDMLFVLRLVVSLIAFAAIYGSSRADTVTGVRGTTKSSILDILKTTKEDVAWIAEGVSDREIIRSISQRSKKNLRTSIFLTTIPGHSQEWQNLVRAGASVHFLESPTTTKVWASQLILMGAALSWEPYCGENQVYEPWECSGGFYNTTAYSQNNQNLWRWLQAEKKRLFEFRKD